MKNWFSDFEACLNGGKASSDLVGAGSADSERAMAHYRFQHQAKMKEAVEVTFPALLRHLGESWQDIWLAFWNQNDISPRSLDWFPEVFMKYFQTTSAPLWQKELARFEHHLDVHPWSHKTLSLYSSSTLSETSKIIMGNHELITFQTSVTQSYEENAPEEFRPETVLLWQKESGVFYRTMNEWELKVFTHLPMGVEVALEFAPEDPEAVGDFFKWLGSSHLIQGLQQD